LVGVVENVPVRILTKPQIETITNKPMMPQRIFKPAFPRPSSPDPMMRYRTTFQTMKMTARAVKRYRAMLPRLVSLLATPFTLVIVEIVCVWAKAKEGASKTARESNFFIKFYD